MAKNKNRRKLSGNPIRNLRMALGMNQTRFAMELDMSIASIQNYERGSRPSDDAVRRMQTLAAERGLDELGISLATRPTYAVQKIYSQGKRVRVPNPHGADLGDALHDQLDVILKRGDPEVIAVLEGVLHLFSRRPEGGKE